MHLNRSLARLLRRALSIAPAGALLFAPTVWVQVSATPSSAAPTAVRLAQYDKNKDGALDAEETAAMNAEQASSKEAAGDDIVTLSPFEIEGGNDIGYHASNTLSGTCLNSKLEDLAAAITVATGPAWISIGH